MARTCVRRAAPGTIWILGAIAALGAAATPAAGINVRLRMIDPPAGCISATTAPDTTITVNIEVSDFPLDPDGEGPKDGGVQSGQFLISYPTECLVFNRVTKPAGSPFDVTLWPGTAENGVIRYAVGNLPGNPPYPPNPIPASQWVVVGVIELSPHGCCSGGALNFTDVGPLLTSFLDPPDNGSNVIIPNKTGTTTPLNVDTVPPQVSLPPPPLTPFNVDLVGESCTGVMPNLCMNLVDTSDCPGGLICTQSPVAGAPIQFTGADPCQQIEPITFTLQDGCGNTTVINSSVSFNRKSPPTITWDNQKNGGLKVVVGADCKLIAPNLCTDPRVHIAPCVSLSACAQTIVTEGVTQATPGVSPLRKSNADMVLGSGSVPKCEYTVQIRLTAVDGCPGSVAQVVTIPVTFVANPTVNYHPVLNQEWPIKANANQSDCVPEWTDYNLACQFFDIAGVNCSGLTCGDIKVIPLRPNGSEEFPSGVVPGNVIKKVVGNNLVDIVPGDSPVTRKVKFRVPACGDYPGEEKIADITFRDTRAPDVPGLPANPDLPIVIVSDCDDAVIPNLCGLANPQDCSGSTCTQLPEAGTPVEIAAGCSTEISIGILACDNEGNCVQLVRTARYQTSPDQPGPLPDLAETVFDKGSNCQNVRPNLCELIDFGNNCMGGWACSQTATTVDGNTEDIKVTVTNTCCPGGGAGCRRERTYRITYADKSAPTLTGVSGNLIVYPPPGQNQAPISVSSITATDNCGVVGSKPTVTIYGCSTEQPDLDAAGTPWEDALTGGNNPANRWESGTRDFLCCETGKYWIKVEASDAAGNRNRQVFTITVPCKNLVKVQLQSSPVERDVARCVELRLCDGAAWHKIDEVMTFSAKRKDYAPGQAYWESRVWADPFSETDKVYEVPIGAYDTVTARSKFHSVTRSLTPATENLNGPTAITRDPGLNVAMVDLYNTTALVARFVGTPAQTPADRRWLLLGNIDGRDSEHRDFIDITDYARLATQFLNQATICSLNVPFQCDLSPDVQMANGQSVNPSRCFNGDFDGNDLVDGRDLSILTSNFLVIGEPTCSLPWDTMPMSVPEPRMSMTVEELKAAGVENAELADRNGDGVVDVQDINLLGSGGTGTGRVRPSRQLPQLPSRIDNRAGRG